MASSGERRSRTNRRAFSVEENFGLVARPARRQLARVRKVGARGKGLQPAPITADRCNFILRMKTFRYNRY